MEFTVPYIHGGVTEDRSYTFHFRPALPAILRIVEDPSLQEHLVFWPEQHYVWREGKVVREWSEVHSGDDWWEMQVC